MAEKKRALQLHPAGPVPGETVAGRPAVQTVETYGGTVRLRWDPAAAVTAFGQMPYFIEFLKTAGLFEDWVEDCPLDYRSPNAPASATCWARCCSACSLATAAMRTSTRFAAMG